MVTVTTASTSSNDRTSEITITDVARLCAYLRSKAHVWVNAGTMYGAETGRGFIRINIACPRQLLMEGLGRMAGALSLSGEKRLPTVK